MSTTLAGALEPARVGVEQMRRDHPEKLELAEVMLGVVPSSFGYLAISPAGLDTYALIVPNFANMPFTLWGFGGVPKELFSLVMYASSRAAGCMYCSAHSCTFALRRGATPAQLVRATAEDGPANARERAAFAMAEGLGSVPATIDAGTREAMYAAFTAAEVEWLVLAAAMMGFLNKFMDATGTPLEQAVVDDVEALIAPQGWAPGRHALEGEGAAGPVPVDGLGTKLSIVPVVPRALRGDKRLTAGVTGTWPAIGEFNEALTGWDVPMLRHLKHARAVKAVGAALRRNLAADMSGVEPLTKAFASLVFATVLESDSLREGSRQMAIANGGRIDDLDSIEAFARHDTDFESSDSIDAACSELGDDLRMTLAPTLVVAKAASPSPVRITATVVREHVQVMSPRQSVELLMWLGLFQMLHRLERFYAA